MLTDTYDHRRSCKLVSDQAAAAELGDLLVRSADIRTAADAGNMLINDEMREALYGPQLGNGKGKLIYSDEVLDELNEHVGELTRPEGLVYEYLQELGYTLISDRVRRKATLSNGTEVVVGKQGRGVTKDVDVALAYRTERDARNLERAAERLARKLVEDNRRIPGLAAKAMPMLGSAQAAVHGHLALSAGNGDES